MRAEDIVVWLLDENPPSLTYHSREAIVSSLLMVEDDTMTK